MADDLYDVHGAAANKRLSADGAGDDADDAHAVHDADSHSDAHTGNRGDAVWRAALGNAVITSLFHQEFPS